MILDKTNISVTSNKNKQGYENENRQIGTFQNGMVNV